MIVWRNAFWWKIYLGNYDGPFEGYGPFTTSVEAAEYHGNDDRCYYGEDDGAMLLATFSEPISRPNPEWW